MNVFNVFPSSKRDPFVPVTDFQRKIVEFMEGRVDSSTGKTRVTEIRPYYHEGCTTNYYMVQTEDVYFNHPNLSGSVISCVKDCGNNIQVFEAPSNLPVYPYSKDMTIEENAWYLANQICAYNVNFDKDLRHRSDRIRLLFSLDKGLLEQFARKRNVPPVIAQKYADAFIEAFCNRYRITCKDFFVESVDIRGMKCFVVKCNDNGFELSPDSLDIDRIAASRMLYSGCKITDIGRAIQMFSPGAVSPYTCYHGSNYKDFILDGCKKAKKHCYKKINNQYAL